MEGLEVDPKEILEMLPDILADFLAGGCECCVVVNFVVTPPGGVAEAGPNADACSAVAEGGADSEVKPDGAAD